jgi:hypothetical protein
MSSCQVFFVVRFYPPKTDKCREVLLKLPRTKSYEASQELLRVKRQPDMGEMTDALRQTFPCERSQQYRLLQKHQSRLFQCQLNEIRTVTFCI